MAKITDIYEKYKNTPMLAMHQIRVAAVALMICDSLSIKVDKENIVKASLLHDIGNIVKFNLNHFPEQNEPEGIGYWQQIKDDFIRKYGNDEHEVSVKITKEINASERILSLVSLTDPLRVVKTKEGNDFEEKICNYADQRVTPHGIASIKERNLEAKERYKNHPNSFDDESSNFFVTNMYDIEKQIFSHSNIKPEDINDESVRDYIEKVKDFEI